MDLKGLFLGMGEMGGCGHGEIAQSTGFRTISEAPEPMQFPTKNNRDLANASSLYRSSSLLSETVEITSPKFTECTSESSIYEFIMSYNISRYVLIEWMVFYGLVGTERQPRVAPARTARSGNGARPAMRQRLGAERQQRALIQHFAFKTQVSR